MKELNDYLTSHAKQLLDLAVDMEHLCMFMTEISSSVSIKN
jgi:hypothetical protein